MDQKELTALKNKATELRIRVIDMIWKAQSGHPGGPLSVADFMTACYFRYMNVRPEEPRWPDRFFYNHQRIQTKTKLTPLELRCQFVA